MGEKRPQRTAVLMKRLRRVAKWLGDTGAICVGPDKPQWIARANTCWQAAARLELLTDPDAEQCEWCCSRVATQRDNVGVPLCDECFAGLDSSVGLVSKP
jgi:hypothetical protein